MSENSSPLTWEQVAAALAQYQRAERETWGEMDNVIVAKFVAGLASDEERRLVEQWCREFPAVRMLVDAVSGVPDRGSGRESGPPPAVSPSTGGLWSAVGDAMRQACAPLDVWRDQGGVICSRGLAAFREETPDPVGAAMGDELQETSWRLPLHPLRATLRLGLCHAGESWRLRVVAEGLSDEAVLQFGIDDDDVDFSDRLIIATQHPLTWRQGNRMLWIIDQGRSWAIPIHPLSEP